MSKIFSGIINIYKEKGYTSHDVVAIVRKLLGKVKTGHTGTLDPQAEGVLPICVGRATKLAGFLTAANKSYRAELILGMTTDTYDNTGEVLTTAPVNFDMPAIEKAVNSFKGGYMQTPPMYSAIRIEGKKLYELARAGKTVERKPRPVEIPRIDIIDADPANNRLWLDIDCSKGTYIRSLCADIGDRLGCGGCMGDLVRTGSGAFSLETALGLSELKQAVAEDRKDFLIPVDQALSVPGALLKGFFKKAINGHPIPLTQIAFEESKAITEGEYCWLYAYGISSLDDISVRNDISSFDDIPVLNDISSLGDASVLDDISSLDNALILDNTSTLIGLYILKAGLLRPEVMMYANNTKQQSF